MKERIVSSEEEIEPLIAEMQKAGLRVGCISNAGLPRGKVRLTFLPESAFIKKSEDELPPIPTVKEISDE